MSLTTKALLVCLILPVALVASYFGKVQYDAVMHNLPGEALKSLAPPTQKLEVAMAAAEQLDAYVQPRFETLKDNIFGMSRLIHRNHAEIVELKVDTTLEKNLIAEVNVTNRDYAINLLHCAEIPKNTHIEKREVANPSLELLYFNQDDVVPSREHPNNSRTEKSSKKNHFKIEPFFDKAVKALPQLRAGKEYRATDSEWCTLMRPVLASKQECLSCHKTSKIGDTLGVMVYAVRKAKRNESTKLSLR